MTTEMIIDSENIMLEEEKFPDCAYYDEHLDHIRGHALIPNKYSLQHIKHHMYMLALEMDIFNGEFADFETVVDGFIIWSWGDAERKKARG